MKLRKPTRRTILIASIALVIVVLIVVGLVGRQLSLSATNNGVHPDYATILPSSKSIDKLGGWERISPPASDPVYAYADTLGSISISVSEQQLPEAFKNDTDKQVAELAKSYSATNKIDADGTKVYIGTSAKGPQSTIFTKNGLLILIKSQAKIDNDTWVGYIKSLK